MEAIYLKGFTVYIKAFQLHLLDIVYKFNINAFMNMNHARTLIENPINICLTQSRRLSIMMCYTASRIMLNEHYKIANGRFSIYVRDISSFGNIRNAPIFLFKFDEIFHSKNHSFTNIFSNMYTFFLICQKIFVVFDKIRRSYFPFSI